MTTRDAVARLARMFNLTREEMLPPRRQVDLDMVSGPCTITGLVCQSQGRLYTLELRLGNGVVLTSTDTGGPTYEYELPEDHVIAVPATAVVKLVASFRAEDDDVAQVSGYIKTREPRPLLQPTAEPAVFAHQSAAVAQSEREMAAQPEREATHRRRFKPGDKVAWPRATTALHPEAPTGRVLQVVNDVCLVRFDWAAPTMVAADDLV